MAHQASSVQVIPRLYLSNLNNDIGEEITEYVASGSVSYDVGRLIPMNLKLSLHEASEVIINPWSDYIAPFMTLRYDDGYEVTSQMGLFNTTPPNKEYAPNKHIADLVGYDVTWRLSVDIFENGHSVAAGTNMVTAITTILTAVGITRSAITPTTLTATVAYSWKPGTSKLVVVNDLLAAMGYVPLYASTDGTVMSNPYIKLNDKAVATTYDTTTLENRVRIVRNVRLDPQFDKVVNKVTVVRQNSNQDVITLTRRNTNPDSPTSITNLGVTIAKFINDSKVIDYASARLLAIRILEEGSYVYERMKIITTPDVARQPRETYQVNIVDAMGNTIADNKYACTQWTIGLTPKDGLMEHTLNRVDNGPQEDEI